MILESPDMPKTHASHQRILIGTAATTSVEAQPTVTPEFPEFPGIHTGLADKCVQGLPPPCYQRHAVTIQKFPKVCKQSTSVST